MNLQIQSFGDVKVLRLKEERLVYPASNLDEFSSRGERGLSGFTPRWLWQDSQ